MHPTTLITGGTSFIGTHVVNHLLKQNHTVIILDDLSGANKTIINPTAAFVKGSILDSEQINTLFK